MSKKMELEREGMTASHKLVKTVSTVGYKDEDPGFQRKQFLLQINGEEGWAGLQHNSVDYKDIQKYGIDNSRQQKYSICH